LLLEELDAYEGSSERLCGSLRLDWRSGAIKLFVLSRALRARRARADLFVDGQYSPLAVSGAYAAHAVAFARRFGDQWAIAVVPRVTTRIANAPQFPVGIEAWRDTAVRLPAGAPSEWRDALCPASIVTSERELVVGEALSGLPVGLVVSS
jgi:(1->4)-alpha-D-glucan 1-alpha-D-glucosylmutase